MDYLILLVSYAVPLSHLPLRNLKFSLYGKDSHHLAADTRHGIIYLATAFRRQRVGRMLVMDGLMEKRFQIVIAATCSQGASDIQLLIR